MRTGTLGISVSPSSIDNTSKACCFSILNFNRTTLLPPKLPHSTSCVSLPKSSRTGIAYISNVAVRERFRQKGIAKWLIAKAEAEVGKWGRRSIALHCDLNNPGASQH